MTNEEKQKAINALKISAPVKAVTQEEFNDYIQTLNRVMDWLEQEPFMNKPCVAHQICREDKNKVLGMNKDYYTLLETANIFKIRIRTVREWLKIGKIQAEKHGTMWRVSASEIDRLKEKMLPTDEKYYSVEEVAARYGVSISTVRRWLHNGLVSYKPTGRKEVYVSESALQTINEYRHK